ncbi:uncharacterized protein LOC141620810 [Silene latifolia]|uniref:uncharacterized protein LOC141620810 n=1 Tax=Silene latifolia TaxID=37657 RepID=UPI003D780DA0
MLRSKFNKYSNFCNYNMHYNGRIWLLWDTSNTKVTMLQEHAQKDPWVVMGDFNIVRYAHEKISNTPPELMDMTDFNTCIAGCGLDDMQGSGSDFVWFNKQEVKTRVYSKLDGVLVNADWLLSFTQTTAQFLPPGISDHCPAILSFSDDPLPKKQFKFLNCWIDHPEFKTKVVEAWQITLVGNSMHRLMAKLKNTRKYLKDLHLAHYSNIGNRINLKREELNQCFLALQQSPFSEVLIHKERTVSQEYWSLKEAETKILIQKAKVHDIKHNDASSKFFFVKIKERQQSQYIGEIQDINGTLHSGMQEDQVALTAPIPKDEINSALFSIHSSKSSSIDGFSSGFFKAAWNIIADDFCLVVLDFFKTNFMPKQANVTLISLIPKKKIVNSVKDFRPISCCSIIYKTISKILTVRLQRVMDKLVGEEQAAFNSGRSLHGNVMLTQSLIKSYSKKNLTPGCMLKVDISKAFDSIQWPFVQNMLSALNFPSPFIKWVMGCVTGAWYTLKMNGSHHGFFKGKSGVRQGDPLSPLLFVLCMEILSRILRVMRRDPNVSFHPKCVNMGLTHLIFADDLLIFTRGDVPSVQKTAEVLQLFSSWPGLRANFDKSEAYFGGVEHKLHSCTTNFLTYAGKLQVLNSIVFGIEWFSNVGRASVLLGLKEGSRSLIFLLGIKLACLNGHGSWILDMALSGWNGPLLDNSLLPRYRIILMLVAQRKLATLDQISKRGLCLPNSFSQQVLRALFTWMAIHIQDLQLRSLLLWSHKRNPRKHWRSKWIICCLASAVYNLWIERNRRVFESKERPVQLLISEIQYTVNLILLTKSHHILHEDIIKDLNS